MESQSPDKIACVFNYAPHYREEIYLRMERELSCDFYFGADTGSRIKKMDYSRFRNNPVELPYTRLVSNFNWLSGAVKLSFKRYKKYIVTGEPFCLSTWLLLLFNKLLGKRSYLWTHGWYGDEKGIKRFVKKLFFGLGNGVLLYGEHARKLMMAEGFKESKLHVIYNSLSYSAQKKIRPFLKRTDKFEKFFKNDLPTVSFVGRLEPKKNLEILFQSLRHCIDHYNFTFNICLIGDGRDRARLEAVVDELKLKKFVWFYGACYEELELADGIYNSDLCVSPGEAGLMVIHSLSFGTPVVTHDSFENQMPEFEAIEKEVTGDFFRFGDAVSLGDTVRQWLQARPVKSLDITQKCFEVIDQKYNPDYQMKLLHQLVDNNA